MFIYFIILLIFSYNSSQAETITDYLNGRTISSSDETLSSSTDDNCNCDLTTSCEYLCCCDKDCPDDALDYWKNHSICINEKDSVGIFADRCIDKHLIWKYNERRGLKRDIQTEDVKKKENAVIDNWCFSIDNNGNENLEQPEDVEKDFGINYNEAKIFEDYFENKILKHYFIETQQKDDNNYIININNKKLISSNSTIFSESGNFMIFSGPDCHLMKTVEISKPVNASCIMRNDTYYNYFNEQYLIQNITFKNSKENCNLNHCYIVNEEGYLRPNYLNEAELHSIINSRVLEIEFILKMDKNGIDVIDCRYNEVILNNSNITNFNFKNSVKFIDFSYDYGQKEKLPYRYSGNVGYLNNFPLKIGFNMSDDNGKYKNHTPNEFLLVGKDMNNDCRIDSRFNEHLYNIDKPLLFGEEYSYSCKYNSAIKGTTLYQLITNITNIGKYGSSSCTNSNDWVKVDRVGESIQSYCSNIDDGSQSGIFTITMEITVSNIVEKNHVFKIISDYNFICEHKTSQENMLTFKIKYIPEENKNKFTEKPKIPAFIPKLPPDLLDPLKTSDVTK